MVPPSNDRAATAPSPNGTHGNAQSIGGRIAKNTAFLAASRLAATAMGVTTLVLTARALDDKAVFGTLLFVHAYMLFFAEVASFKSWQAIVRFGADDLAEGRPDRFGRLVRLCAGLDAGAAVAAYALAVIGYGAAVWLATLLPGFSIGAEASDVDLGELRGVIAWYCIAILFRQTNVATGLCRLFDRFGALAFRGLVMPGMRLGGVIYAASAGWGLSGFLAVWFCASVAGYAVLIVLGIAEAHRQGLLRHALQAPRGDGQRQGLWSFLWKANVGATLDALKKELPSLLIMLTFGPALLAIFRIAEEIARLLSRGVAVFDQVLFPELSKLAVSSVARLRTVAGKVAIGAGLGSTVLIALVALGGPMLLETGLGSGYAKSSDLAVLLLAAAGLMAIAVPFYTAFYALKQPGQAIFARGTGVAIYLAAFFALIAPAQELTPGWAALVAAAAELFVVLALAQRAFARTTEPVVREP